MQSINIIDAHPEESARLLQFPVSHARTASGLSYPAPQVQDANILPIASWIQNMSASSEPLAALPSSQQMWMLPNVQADTSALPQSSARSHVYSTYTDSLGGNHRPDSRPTNFNVYHSHHHRPHPYSQSHAAYFQHGKAQDQQQYTPFLNYNLNMELLPTRRLLPKPAVGYTAQQQQQPPPQQLQQQAYDAAAAAAKWQQLPMFLPPPVEPSSTQSTEPDLPLREGMYTSTQCLWEGCNLQFDDFEHLKQHIDYEHVGYRKPHYYCKWKDCKQLGHIFRKRHKLTIHMRTHTNERPFSCPFVGCQHLFVRQDALINHQKVHSLTKGWPCPIEDCSRAYFHSKSLKKHLREAHECDEAEIGQLFDNIKQVTVA